MGYRRGNMDDSDFPWKLIKIEEDICYMTTIYQLANAFLRLKPMTNKQLQKMCYYAKAWHLALYDTNIIKEQFEAWAHGPVNRNLYNRYKDYGWSVIDAHKIYNGDPPTTEEARVYAEQIMAAYGHLDANELEIVSHSELPWIEARGDKRPWESCTTVISEESMKNFYRQRIQTN